MKSVREGVSFSVCWLSLKLFIINSVQSLSHVQHFATPWTAVRQASLSINSQSSLKLMSIKSTPRAHSNSCPLSQWYHPTISSSVIPFSCLQSLPASGSFPLSQFFTSGGQNIGSFSFSISSSNEYSGLISFRMDWLDLLTVQGTLKSLLQHHSSKASILWHSIYFINCHIHTWPL